MQEHECELMWVCACLCKRNRANTADVEGGSKHASCDTSDHCRLHDIGDGPVQPQNNCPRCVLIFWTVPGCLSTLLGFDQISFFPAALYFIPGPNKAIANWAIKKTDRNGGRELWWEMRHMPRRESSSPCSPGKGGSGGGHMSVCTSVKEIHGLQMCLGFDRYKFGQCVALFKCVIFRCVWSWRSLIMRENLVSVQPKKWPLDDLYLHLAFSRMIQYVFVHGL